MQKSFLKYVPIIDQKLLDRDKRLYYCEVVLILYIFFLSLSRIARFDGNWPKNTWTRDTRSKNGGTAKTRTHATDTK